MSEEELMGKKYGSMKMKEDYFKKSMETLQRIEDNLKEQKIKIFRKLLWFIILIWIWDILFL